MWLLLGAAEEGQLEGLRVAQPHAPHMHLDDRTLRCVRFLSSLVVQMPWESPEARMQVGNRRNRKATRAGAAGTLGHTQPPSLPPTPTNHPSPQSGRPSLQPDHLALRAHSDAGREWPRRGRRGQPAPRACTRRGGERRGGMAWGGSGALARSAELDHGTRHGARWDYVTPASTLYTPTHAGHAHGL